MSDYQILKLVLRQEVHNTSEGYSYRFRVVTPENQGTGHQLAVRLSGYSNQQTETARLEESFEVLEVKVVVQQYTNCCKNGLVDFFKERKRSSVEKVVTTRDNYLKVHRQTILGPRQACGIDSKVMVKRIKFQKGS